MKLRALFLAVGLWVAVGIPAVSVWQNRPVEASPAAIDPATGAEIAAEVTAVCLGLPVACPGWIATSIIVAIGAVGVAYLTHDAMMNLIDGLADKFSADGPGVQQYKLQWQNHPNYVDLTPEMSAEMAAAIGSLEDAGWVSVSGWGTTVYQLALAQGSQMVLSTSEITLPTDMSSNHIANQSEGGGAVPRGPDGLGNAQTAGLYWYNTGTIGAQYCSTGCLISEFTFGDTTNSLGDYNASCGGFPQGCVMWLGETGHFVLKYPEYPAQMAGNVYAYGAQPFTRLVWNSTSYSDLMFADFTAVGVTYWDTAAGKRVTQPLSVATLAGYTGTNAIPLADGTTGNPLADAPTTPAEDHAWRENALSGLTGGITGIGQTLGNIWGVVQAIPGDIAAVGATVADLPAALVNALTDAVVPNESVQTRADELRDRLNAKAPWAWPGLVFVLMGSLFDGGDSCPVVGIPTSDMGWGSDISITMCLPPTAKSIVYMLWDAAAVLMVTGWAWWTYRRIVGT